VISSFLPFRLPTPFSSWHPLRQFQGRQGPTPFSTSLKESWLDNPRPLYLGPFIFFALSQADSDSEANGCEMTFSRRYDRAIGVADRSCYSSIYKAPCPRHSTSQTTRQKTLSCRLRRNSSTPSLPKPRKVMWPPFKGSKVPIPFGKVFDMPIIHW